MATLGVLLAAASLASEASAQDAAMFSYDAQGQVTSVGRDGAAVGYAYDQAGNRAVVTGGTIPPGEAPLAEAAAMIEPAGGEAGQAEAMARLRATPAGRAVPPPAPTSPGALPPAMIRGVVVAHPGGATP